MKISIKIAQESKIKPIDDIASMLGIEDYIEPYGNYMAKILIDVLKKASRKKNARFVLVTVMTPTAAEKMDIDANGRIYGLF